MQGFMYPSKKFIVNHFFFYFLNSKLTQGLEMSIDSSEMMPIESSAIRTYVPGKIINVKSIIYVEIRNVLFFATIVN